MTGQDVYPDMFRCATQYEPDIESDARIWIYITSDPRCGFCQRAIRQIGKFGKESGEIAVIAMDVSEKISNIREHESLQFYNEFDISLVDASTCEETYKKLIPKVFVFDETNSKLLWKSNGWGEKDLVKLEKKISKYLEM